MTIARYTSRSSGDYCDIQQTSSKFVCLAIEGSIVTNSGLRALRRAQIESIYVTLENERRIDFEQVQNHAYEQALDVSEVQAKLFWLQVLKSSKSFQPCRNPQNRSPNYGQF